MFYLKHILLAAFIFPVLLATQNIAADDKTVPAIHAPPVSLFSDTAIPPEDETFWTVDDSKLKDVLRILEEEYINISFLEEEYYDPAMEDLLPSENEESACIKEESIETPCSDARAYFTSVRVYRDIRTVRSLVFFGDFHAPEWNKIPIETKTETKRGLSLSSLWGPPEYVKVVSGLSP